MVQEKPFFSGFQVLVYVKESMGFKWYIPTIKRKAFGGDSYILFQ
jgi:hypothetical protein